MHVVKHKWETKRKCRWEVKIKAEVKEGWKHFYNGLWDSVIFFRSILSIFQLLSDDLEIIRYPTVNPSPVFIWLITGIVETFSSAMIVCIEQHSAARNFPSGCSFPWKLTLVTRRCECLWLNWLLSVMTLLQ